MNKKVRIIFTVIGAIFMFAVLRDLNRGEYIENECREMGSYRYREIKQRLGGDATDEEIVEYYHIHF